MNNVQLQLAAEGISKRAGVASCDFNTDKNFPVLKGKYVRRARLSEKLPMQKRHPSIGNQPDENLGQLAQVSLFSLLQLQTTLDGIFREPLEFCNVD